MKTLATIVLLLACAAGAAGQSGGPSSTPPPAAPSPPPVEIGFEHRFRMETWNNIIDFTNGRDDRRTQFRFRTRVWTRIRLGARVEVYAGLDNEARSITTPDQPTVLGEIIYEHLYVDWQIDRRYSIRAGRQNIMRGDGLILFDANPLDGSRSAYFNAIVATRTYGGKSTLELMAIDNPYRARYLRPINDQNMPLVEWDERAFAAYLIERRIPQTQLEAYFLHKTERNDIRGPTHPQYHADRRLEMLGARVVNQRGSGWTLTGEFAGEWGRLTEQDTWIRAWAGYGFVKKTWAAPWKPAVQVGALGMSGDNPGTDTIEDWHPAFARWPRWSELYIYSLAPERGVAYWTNLTMFRAECTATPAATVGLRAAYSRLGALHPMPGPATTFGSGTERGHLLEARVDVTISRSLRGHVLYEGLWPGDFYRGTAQGHFFRTELTYTFRHGFGKPRP